MKNVILIKEIEEMLKSGDFSTIDNDPNFTNLCEGEGLEYARYFYLILKGVEQTKLIMTNEN